MDKDAIIGHLNALFPPEYVGPNKGIGLTLLYRRRAVVSGLQRATSPKDTDTLARTLLLRQYGIGRLLWEQRDAILALLTQD